MTQDCPGAERLAEFVTGSLEESHAEQVLDHLETCSTCAAAAEQQMRLGPAATTPAPVPSERLLRALRAIDGPSGIQAAHETPSLNQAATIAARGREADEPRPLDLPGYEIIRRIARGGMGVVYEARQHQPNRTVALKMILAGQFASDEEIRRFHQEAESAAGLDHPGIVPIYEVGEHRGQHFYSMGLVAGRTLKQVLADEVLSSRDAASLLHQLALAVSYAHQRGVIHRDLKPANVLVDRENRPRITDFGLAKRTDRDSQLTGTGDVMGTPGFMPPEQARGESVTEAADIYSLGAVLYNMLTGRPPFQAASAVETIRLVTDAEAVPPRQLNELIDRDLETICLKCLEKDASRRYATAAELAADLHRYLDGEPIQARPVSRAERAVKWARKRPAITAMMGLVAVVTTAGVAFSAYHWNRAVRERDDRTAAQLRAEANLQKARDAVLTMLTRVGDERLRNVPQMSRLREKLLQDAVRFNKSLLELSDEPSIRADVADTQLILARIYNMLGQKEQTVAALDSAISMLDALHAEHPEVRPYHTSLIRAHVLAAETYQGMSEHDRATTACGSVDELISGIPLRQRTDQERRLVAATQAVRAASHAATGSAGSAETAYRDALTTLATVTPSGREEPEFRQQQAEVHLALGVLLSPTQNTEGASEQFAEALTILDRLATESPDERTYQEDYASACFTVAGFKRDIGEFDEAETLAARALAAREQLASDFPHIPDFRNDAASAMSLLAITLAVSQQTSKAAPFFKRARDESQALLDDFPDVVLFERTLARHEKLLGIFYHNTRDTLKSRTPYNNARERFEDLNRRFPDDPQYLAETAATYGGLRNSYFATGEFDESLQWSRKEIDLLKKLRSLEPANYDHVHRLASAYRWRGETFRAQGELDQAETNLITAIELHKLVAEKVPEKAQYQRLLAEAHVMMARYYVEFDDYATAVKLFSEAITIQDALVSRDQEWSEPRDNLVETLQQRGRARVRLNDQLKAMADFDRAVQICLDMNILAGEEPMLIHRYALTLEDRAALYQDLGERSKARVDRETAVHAMRTITGMRPDDVRLPEYLFDALIALSEMEIEDGNLQAAEVLLREAIDLKRTSEERLLASAECLARLAAESDATDGTPIDELRKLAVAQLETVAKGRLRPDAEALLTDARFTSLATSADFARLRTIVENLPVTAPDEESSCR